MQEADFFSKEEYLGKSKVLSISSFLMLNNIPLYGCTTVCVSIHLLKDILADSSF